MKNRGHILFVLIMMFITSCQERIWENPYDENMSADYDWSPYIYDIRQEDEAIIIEFGNNETIFDSYIIERSIDNGSFSKIATLNKDLKSWKDTDVVFGGKEYRYKIYVRAGKNVSGYSETMIIPYLTPQIEIEIINKDHISANANVTILDDGGHQFTFVAVCWSTSDHPSINSKGYNQIRYESGRNNKYEIEITELNPRTKYYIIGTVFYYYFGNQNAYSGIQMIETDSLLISKEVPFYDSRDGHEYQTTNINGQVWMTENFEYDLVGSSSISKFGKLYNWESANLACPTGWHLPSTDEWFELVNYLGGNFIGVDRMRSTWYWFQTNGGTNGNNESGMEILPAGCIFPDDSFLYLYQRAYFWCSDEYNSSNAYGIEIDNFGGLMCSDFYKDRKYSVRYIKN